MSKTYKPKTKKHQKTHGFLVRKKTSTGTSILKNRRRKGRAKLTIQASFCAYMLPQNKRVDSETLAFLLTQKPSKIGQTEYLRVLVYKNTDSHKLPRICFIAPKKKYKKATTRNLLKRRGFSLVEEHKKLFKNGYIYIFFFQSKITTFFVIKKEIEALLKKINIA